MGMTELKHSGFLVAVLSCGGAVHGQTETAPEQPAQAGRSGITHYPVVNSPIPKGYLAGYTAELAEGASFGSPNTAPNLLIEDDMVTEPIMRFRRLRRCLNPGTRGKNGFRMHMACTSV